MWRRLLSSLTLAMAVVQANAQEGIQLKVARWPADRQAAISLTFDDALLTHLQVVGPILRKHQLNGTFYVATGNERWRDHIPEWRRLAQDGNEIGNHTVTHPCLLAQIVPHSQTYTPAMMEADILDAAKEISAQIKNSRGLTFAYPCGSLSFGPVADQVHNAALFLGYLTRSSFAARGYGTSGPIGPNELNIMVVPDLGMTEGKNFPSLLALAYTGLQDHKWGVYCFHGVGGDWLSTPAESLDELADYLEKHPEIWTATFGDVIRYIQESKALGIKQGNAGQNRVEFELTWPLDRRVFDLPLTLKSELPRDWKAGQVLADEKSLPLKLAEGNNSQTLLLDVLPGTSHLVIVRR